MQVLFLEVHIDIDRLSNAVQHSKSERLLGLPDTRNSAWSESEVAVTAENSKAIYHITPIFWLPKP